MAIAILSRLIHYLLDWGLAKMRQFELAYLQAYLK